MNPSTAQALVMVDEFIRCGVTDAIVSPGSRSAPLAMALAQAEERGEISLHVRLDERSAGFLAIGIAKDVDSKEAYIRSTFPQRR